MRRQIAEAFVVFRKNLSIAENDPGGADEALRENLVLARSTIASIRSAVAKLREDAE